ncbi:hypothetical protein J6590_006141 [Homalodisca vitripennis]|nr:hypothetical protein J6590_006141 [Homalodisca vitripennis]
MSAVCLPRTSREVDGLTLMLESPRITKLLETSMDQEAWKRKAFRGLEFPKSEAVPIANGITKQCTRHKVQLV